VLSSSLRSPGPLLLFTGVFSLMCSNQPPPGASQDATSGATGAGASAAANGGSAGAGGATSALEPEAGAANGGAADGGAANGGAANGGAANGGAANGGAGVEAGAPPDAAGASFGGTTSASFGGTTSAAAGATSAGAASGGASPTGGVSAVSASVFTRSNDLQRSGSNLKESVLTPAVVRSAGFGKLFCKPVDDEIYGQLLYVSALDVGGKTRDVIFAVTMNDSVYAFDAHAADADPLWHVNYADPKNGITPVSTADLSGVACSQYRDFSRQIGITSTPVIDPNTFTMYLNARTKENGVFVQRLHALDIRSGKERPGSPVKLEASVPGTGTGSVDGKLSLEPLLNNQRAGLVLHDNTVYLAFGSHCDGGSYHGWLLGYDARSLSRVATYATTPNGWGGGIWMSGMAPAVDGEGHLYLTTANGSADVASGGGDRAQSFVKLKRQAAGLLVVDWFTPVDWSVTNLEDRDVGSTGALLLPSSNRVLGGSKEGVLYLLDTNDLGKFNENGNAQIVQTVPVTGTHRSHVHGTPVYWKSAGGEYVYVMPEEEHLQQYRVKDGKLVLAHVSEVISPVDHHAASTTMPGGILALTANGDTNDSGLIWATTPIAQDANQQVVSGVLRVFDANDVTHELWNSEQDPNDAFGNLAKFNPPTVVNGRAYVPTFSGQFCVYGGGATRR